MLKPKASLIVLFIVFFEWFHKSQKFKELFYCTNFTIVDIMGTGITHWISTAFASFTFPTLPTHGPFTVCTLQLLEAHFLTTAHGTTSRAIEVKMPLVIVAVVSAVMASLALAVSTHNCLFLRFQGSFGLCSNAVSAS